MIASATNRQEPVVVEDVNFVVRRMLRTGGDVSIHPGDRVEPETSLGVATAGAGRTVTLHLARELGVAPDTIGRYLAKPIGARFDAGESVARARRGLRSATAETPVSGKLQEINEVNGTATIVPESDGEALHALVHGEVEQVIDGRGALIRATGARVRGAFALGQDVHGPIKVAVDRHDRELTPDGITPDLRGSIVLGGMTVGATALRRLVEMGVRGVIVGSIAEGEVRRFAAGSGAERTAQSYWQAIATSGPLTPESDQLPITVFVTEGFGRRQMATSIFKFLSDREGQSVSLLMPDRDRPFPSYPGLYFTGGSTRHGNELPVVSPSPGYLGRLVDPQHLGTVVICRGEPVVQRLADGVAHAVIEVRFGNGSQRMVRLANLEVLSTEKRT